MLSNKNETNKVTYKWKPIELIADEEENYDFHEIDSLQNQWLQIKRDVENSTPDAYKNFTERLTRRWAIETGIIEGIYELDIGVTKTLVNNGITADYIERGSTNKEPSELVQILKDHEASVTSVNSWIEEGRHLTRWFICALHSQILNNQHTTKAMDQFGTRFDAKLVKGEFKTFPNNPTRLDGRIHEYCPPEQVESEIDNLLSFYEEYDKEGCHPILLAAWLHHRFEQIHPFQDGNGRVGRAILTWHLVKNHLFPIVISRDDRSEYIRALEQADTGDMKSLIDLFVRLEKNTILQALAVKEGEAETTIPEPQAQVDLVDQAIGALVKREERRRKTESEQMRSVNEIATALRDKCEEYLYEKSENIEVQFEAVGITIRPSIFKGGPGNNEHWYHRQVIETANAFQQWVNLFEPRYYIKLSLNPYSGASVPRLSFVISLHNTGRQLTGIMAATAFAEIEYDEDGETITSQRSRFDNSTFMNCTLDPFTFTWEDSAEKICDRFIRWTEVCFSVALRYWMDNS